MTLGSDATGDIYYRNAGGLLTRHMKKLLAVAALSLLASTNAVSSGNFYIDPLDAPYSAACAAGVDDAIPLQAALNDAAAHGLALFIRRNCYFGTELHVNAVPIFGVTMYQSGFTMLNPSQRGLVVVSGSPTGGGAVDWRNFFVTSGTVPTAGAAIGVDPGGRNVNTGSRFENVSIPVGYDGIDFERAAFWTIMDPNIGEPTLSLSSRIVHRGIVIRNLVQQDYGDSLISGGLVATGQGSLDAIYQESSAGLKIDGTKIVGAPQNCFHFKQVSTRAMGGLVISSDSIEGCTVNGILIEQNSPSSGQSINGLVITDNQIGGGSGSSFVGINTTSGDHTAWIRGATIADNIIMANQTGSMGGIVVDGIDDATITGNSVFNNSGAITGFGYIVGSWSRNGYIGRNSMAYAAPSITPCTIGPLGAGNPGPQIRYEAATPCL
jgi:hypothetical protein